jgi:hypothetical protein
LREVVVCEPRLFAGYPTQPLAARKFASALAKPALSTATGLLYYYCYLFI